MTTTIKLTKPITAHGEEISELALREPTGKDLRSCGAPYRLVSRDDGSSATEFNTEAVAKLIAALAGIPPSAVDKMSARDFQAAMTAIVGFFGAPAETPADS